MKTARLISTAHLLCKTQPMAFSGPYLQRHISNLVKEF